MELADKLSSIAQRGREQMDHIKTEEATKTALVMPLLAALGYDPFDPREVACVLRSAATKIIVSSSTQINLKLFY